jgi:hypothetical protein
MSTPQLVRWQRFIILAHIALAVLFGVIVPPWEAHDETGHFAYVNHLVTARSLPDAKSDAKVFLDQSHQPPLYYAVVAGLTFWVDRSDQLTPQPNLFAFDGTNRRGTRILLRERGEAFPWQGTILALHMARLVSALLSGLMMLLIAKTTRRLFAGAQAAALLATAFAAFNPQVLFMAGMVNNDIMISLLGAALASLIVRLITSQVGTDDAPIHPSPAPPVRLFALTGLVLALCLWSKNSGLILIPFTALALLYLAWRRGWPLRDFLARGVVTALALLTVAAPLYLSNYARYGQWIVDRAATSSLIRAPGSLIGEGLAVSLRDQWLPQIFVNAFRTFWGAFGWGNVQMPDAVYIALAVFTLIGLLGFIFGLRRTHRVLRDGLLLLLLMGVAMLLLPTYRALFYQDPALLPGRYLLPALCAYMSVLGYGWYTLLQSILITTDRYENGTLRIGDQVQHFERYDVKNNLLGLAPVMAVLCGLLVLAAPFLVIAPAYAPPPISQSPDNTPALLTFEDVAQVTRVNAEVTYLSDREGQRHYAHVTLTWRALKTSSINYAFGISILGRDAEVLGNLNVQPARGNYPSRNWNAGDTFEDAYYVLLERPCPQLPALGRVSVSMYEYVQANPDNNTIGISLTHELQARDGAGRPVAPLIGRFRIDAPTQPIPVFWQPALGMLDGIALRAHNLPVSLRPGSTFTLTLTYETWKGGNPPGTGFVHLLDERGQPVSQDDHAAVHGAYPSDLWQVGECVADTFTLPIPITARGNLRAVTGFYDAQGVRFNTGTPDNLVPLGTIQIAP